MTMKHFIEALQFRARRGTCIGCDRRYGRWWPLRIRRWSGSFCSIRCSKTWFAGFHSGAFLAGDLKSRNPKNKFYLRGNWS